MENEKMTDELLKKYKEALEKIAALQPADFNAAVEYWENGNYDDGNYDDGFEYGVGCGQYDAACVARDALKE